MTLALREHAAQPPEGPSTIKKISGDGPIDPWSRDRASQLGLEPCFSMRLVMPFVKYFHLRLGLTDPLTMRLLQQSLDERLPARVVFGWLEAAEHMAHDPDLGLRALEYVGDTGWGDVVEYVAASASDWGEALSLIQRYVRLLNEAAEFSIHVERKLAIVTLRSRLPLTRTATDFGVGLVALVAKKALGRLDGFEIRFTHERPVNLETYHALFAPARLVFGADHDAIIFDAQLLREPMKSADPNLNAVLRRHAEQLVAALPDLESCTACVRRMLLELIPQGNTNARYAAARLRISRRTLTRHLEREGETYKNLLEQTRRELAFQYLERGDLDVRQIALSLGYSETAAFSRAFKRWTGKRPVQVRRTSAALAAPPH